MFSEMYLVHLEINYIITNFPTTGGTVVYTDLEDSVNSYLEEIIAYLKDWTTPC